MKYLSKSAINGYLWCPMKYKLQFVDKIKMPPSEPLIRGKAIHSALELYYDNINVNTLYEDYKKEIDSAMFKSEQAQKYKHLMLGFYNFEVIRAGHCIKYKKDFETYFIPKYRELRISNKELELVGIIDTVPVLFNDTIGIFDYKSSEKEPPKILSEYLKEEIMFYYILFSKEFEDKVGLLGIIYTNSDNPLRTIQHSKELEDKVYDIIDFVRTSIEMGMFPKTKETYKCNICEYKDECIRETSR